MNANEDILPMIWPIDYSPGPPQGQWTYQAYAAMPYEGYGYEVIQGVLYKLPTPWLLHQMVRGYITHQLYNHVHSTGLGKVYGAPLDVELAFNTIVQPDMLIVLPGNFHKLTSTQVVGAPDVVIEILAPNGAEYDRWIKQDAYARAGVSEYWLPDPHSQTSEVLTLEQGTYRSLGVYQGKAVYLQESFLICRYR